MKILSTISYYTPHISGLTVCAQRLISGLAKHDLKFTVLTSQYDPTLLRIEKMAGAEVVRVPTLFTVGKVPVMPAFPLIAWKLVQQSDIVWIHVPQIEGLLVAWYAKILHKTIIVTVHCLPLLPSGWQRILFQPLSDFINNSIIKLADHVVYYTKDYAENIKELFHNPKKSSYIFPPIPSVSRLAVRPSTRSAFILGLAGRIAEDKGVEYLLEALQQLNKQGESVKLLIAGPRDAVGEKNYEKKIDQLLKDSGSSVKFLGTIQPEQMAMFYRSIDCLVLPSVNRTEAFGMVQIEAMKHGVPVIASNLPGVRIPIQVTKSGKIVAPRNSYSIAQATQIVHHSLYSRASIATQAAKHFSISNTLKKYVNVIEHQIET